MSDTVRYAWPSDNIAPSATVTVQAGSAATGYGPTYLTDLSDVNLGRPALASGSNISFQLDFGSAVSIVAVVLWSNADASLNVRWQGNSSAVWTSPAMDAALAILGVRPDGYYYRIWKSLTGVTGYAPYRYYLLKIPTNSVPPGAKLLCLTQLRTFNRNCSWGVKQPETQSRVQLHTDGGARWAYDLQAVRRSLELTFEFPNDADRAAVRAWLQAAGVKPIVILPDPTLNDPWITYYTGPSLGQAQDGLASVAFDPTLQFIDLAQFSLAFDELTAGGPEWS